jgi:PAS domain S-box-containing protein
MTLLKPSEVAAAVHVLIIEDNPVDRDLFRRLLQGQAHRAFETHECAQGRAALDQVLRLRPACVLLDLNLPDMDGIEVLRSIAGEPDACPVIVMTAYGNEAIAVEAMKAGAADYLVKGTITQESLARVIDNVIEKRSLQRQIEEQRFAIEERNRELEVALERYRVLAEAMPQLVWSAEHPSGAWDYVNQRWTQLTGSPASDALGHGWLNFIDARDQETIGALWPAAVLENDPIEVECRLSSPSGQSRWQLMRAVPLLKQGLPVKWIGTLTDIEDQRRAEQLLHQRQKLDSIGVLAGGVAHDFNNLLVGIVGGVSYALELLPRSHESRPILENALRSGERAAELTRQLLAYAGKSNFQPTDVNLQETLRSTWNLLQASIPRTVDLKLFVPDDLPPVHADPAQLQQIVMNLILNSAEAIPDQRQGLIIVRGYAEHVHASRSTWSGELSPGNYVVMEVLDNGIGIQPELLHKIFDPFFTTKFTGRGLGLAAVHGIVRSNHGLIEADSTPGQGATFRIFLPAGALLKKPAAEAQPANPRSSTVAQILVVDDEPIVRCLAKIALERVGHVVRLASSGQEAVECVERSPSLFSLVLLDFNMPGMSGDQTFDSLRSIRHDLPIVICSGYSEAEIRTRFRGRSVSGFLQKPFRADTLWGRVSAWLTRS